MLGVPYWTNFHARVCNNWKDKSFLDSQSGNVAAMPRTVALVSPPKCALSTRLHWTGLGNHPASNRGQFSTSSCGSGELWGRYTMNCVVCKLYCRKKGACFFFTTLALLLRAQIDERQVRKKSGLIRRITHPGFGFQLSALPPCNRSSLLTLELKYYAIGLDSKSAANARGLLETQKAGAVRVLFCCAYRAECVLFFHQHFLIMFLVRPPSFVNRFLSSTKSVSLYK